MGYKNFRSCAEAVQRNENSEEEQNREEWKKRRITTEEERGKSWDKGFNGREEEIRKREYGLALRGNVSDRDENLTTPSYTNLTSLSTTTRYLTEEVRNLCKLMERRLSMAEERFEKFEDRQKRQQEEFFERINQRDKMNKNKENWEKEEDKGNKR